MSVSFLFPPAVNENYCSPFLWTFSIVSVSHFRHFNRSVVLSYCCFNLQFPGDIWCWVSVICIFSVTNFSWWCVCLNLLPICNYIVFLLLSVKSSLHTLDTSPLWDALQNLSSSPWLTLHSLISVFKRAEVFHFNEAHLIIFFFLRSHCQSCIWKVIVKPKVT